jgi:hypothetical protein
MITIAHGKGSVPVVNTILCHAASVRRKIYRVNFALAKSGGSFIWAMRALTPSPAMFQKDEAFKYNSCRHWLHAY